MRLNRLPMFALVCLSALPCATPARAQQFPESTYQELRWRMIGPTRGGRTRAACGVPSQPNVFYMGQVNGGVWKSDDYGRTWTPIFDEQPTQAVGSIAVAPANPDIIYVGSGEGLARPDLAVGNGIYKSTDAGKTWTHLSALRDSQGVPSLAVDPHDPHRVFAAVSGHPYGANEQRGIYLSTDGGESWSKVLGKSEDIGGDDVEIDPSNSDIVYATLWEFRLGPWEDANQYNGPGGGLFKSTDGGKNWQQLSTGLPKGITQAHLTISPSQTSRLFATIASVRGETGMGSEVGIYRSDDSGASWQRITTDPRPAGRIGGGDLSEPKVDPKNPDIVYVASTVTMKSVDGGKTWASFHGAPGGDDYQNLWINPNNPGTILLVSDQGAQVTVNGGKTWSSWYNQPTAQLYHVIASNAFPYLVCGGQQESGSVCVSSRGNDGEITFRDWHPVGVIEYGYAAPDPLNPDIIYGAGRREVSKYSIKTGQMQDVTPVPVGDPKYRADRTQPIMFSPVDPHVLYTTMNYLFKSADGGHSWQTISPDLAREKNSVPASLGNTAARDPNAEKQRGVIYSLAPSFKTLNTIWAGTDDGLVWITRDGGTNWKNISPPDFTSWMKVSQISASHFDDDTAYVSVSGLRIDDPHPHIYRTHDSGKSWQSISNGLPDSPVNTVREDSVRKGLLFAGTETSVWVSFDDGDHWQSLQLNLPHSSMRDLSIHEDDLLVGTHGRSFWVLDDITPLRQISDAMQKAEAFLFRPGSAYRVKRDTNTDTPIPPDEPTALNPPDGAAIDYFLAQPAAGPLTLEILDAQNKVVRRYASTDPPRITEEELARQLIPPYWTRIPKRLSTDAGMHRWVWDLHYTAPYSTRSDYPIAAVPHDTPRLPEGPGALPGRYTVRLTVNGHAYSEPLIVKMDPRIKATPEGLAQLFQAQSRLASMMSESSEAVVQARSAEEQLQKLAGQASGALADSIAALDKKIGVLAGAGGGGFFAAPSPKPTLGRSTGEVATLYAALDRGDYAPTASQSAAIERAAQGFAPLWNEWRAIKSTDIPALNKQLAAANLPAIKLESKTGDADDSEDVE